QAMALYIKHLKPEGVIAFHVSNNYLDLAPVVRQIAEHAGYQAVLVHSKQQTNDLILNADWVLVTRNESVLGNAAVRNQARPIASRAGLRPWTDQYSSLVQVLKPPEMR
ncbi:MAG TPA: hypothetical protein VLI55_03975, partial [Bryobacteraceae bacterium]|nr:hypothetical protein [Bryobacteraceae bacterium]